MGHDLSKAVRPPSGQVLVTGAEGYLGRHVMTLGAKRGHAMTGVTRTGPHALDLTSAACVGALLKDVQPGVIVHCAAEVPSTGAGYDDRAAAERSLAMCEALVRHAACPIVFASSMTVYGDAQSLPAKEDAAAPTSAYAEAKLAAERLFADRAKPGSAALRLAGLFGAPRRNGLLYNAAAAFLACRPFEIDAHPSVWAGLDVRDAADYLLRAATRAAEGFAVYNVSYPGTQSVNRAVKAVARLCGYAWDRSEAAPLFSMDLTRTLRDLGGLSLSFEQRLAELVADVAADTRAAVRVGH